MSEFLLIGLGATAGGLLRRLLAGIEGSLAFIDVDIRWSTILINTLGSFAIGCLFAMPEEMLPRPQRLFFGAGLCGGFTALSSFSVETMTLLRQGDRLLAGINIGASVAAGLLAAAAGYGLTRHLLGA